MGDKKNIDRLFREKFKDFEVAPDDSLWSRIESELDAKSNKNKKAIPFWWKLGGVAATLALLFAIGYNSLKSDNSNIINSITNNNTEEPLDNGTRSIPNEGINSTNNDDDTLITEKDSDGIKKGESDNRELTITESFVNNNTNDKSGKTNKSSRYEKINYTNPVQNNNTNYKANAETVSGQNNGNTDQERNSVAQNTSTRQNNVTEDPEAFNNQDKEVKHPSNKDQIAGKDRYTFPDNENNPKEVIVENEGKEPLNNGNANPERISVAQNTTPRQNGHTEDDPNTFNNNDEDEISKDGKKSLIEVAEEQEKEKEILVAKTEENRWSINPNVAPVYYNSIGSGSPIDTQFSDNSKSGDINMSYGINIAYQVNEKLSVRSGVNKVNYGYNTQGVEFTSSTQGEVMHNVNYSARSANIKVSDNNSGLNSSAETNAFANVISASGVNVFEGAMNQSFAYLEVPLELKYRITDSKFGINLIGGVSSLFLTDNQIILESSDLVTEIGEANNVNDVNFSTNIGIGFDYKFTKALQFSVEPMFKYQLNAFTNDGGFKPYSLGIYTGFNFKF